MLISCLPVKILWFSIFTFSLKSFNLNMQRFLKVFNLQTCKVIGMIHVDALPGERSSQKVQATRLNYF